MFWIEISTILAALLLVFVFVQQTRQWKSKNKKRLPPGPKGLPIFGCLHMLGKFPYKDLHVLAQRYGPIMHLRLGLIPNIIVSSAQAAELFLKTHDLVFASRPPHLGAKHIGFDQKTVSFSQYGPYWRNMRKMCTLELLSNLKINSFKAMRNEEVSLLIKSIIEEGTIVGNVKSVDLSEKVASLTTNMSYLMVFGKKYVESEFDERWFKSIVLETAKLYGAFNLADYIPFIAPLDLQGLTKRMKAVSKVYDSLFEKVIDEHLRSKDEKKTKDFVDILLSIMGSQESKYRIERSNIKAILLDMLLASMETSSTTIEWILAELIKHPKVMKKVQKELEHVVGMERMVDESDLESLEYLDMVVKETFRLHAVVPLLLPHAAIEDCTINGYHIPQGSRVIINTWAIGRDPSVWTDADKFYPERFVGNNIDVKGHDFQLIPFGSGRRVCPGLQLGLIVVKLVVAQLVHCFDWELPNGMLPNELDMTEVFGLTTPRAQHLLAVPTYRLQKKIEVSM